MKKMSDELQPQQLPGPPGDALGADSGGGARQIRMTRPPTTVTSAACHAVSMLTATQFGTYAAISGDVSNRFAQPCARLAESLARETGWDSEGAATDPPVAPERSG
jgi:hypothetical protein